MSFLNNLSISKNINGGFGSAVLLLVIVAAVVVMSLFSVNGNFVEFRRLAFSANDVGQVQANMLQTSLGVKDFIINGTDESIDRVRKRAKETVRLADAALKQEDDPARRKVIQGVQEKVKAYAAAFETVTILQGKRTAVMTTMATVGPQVEKALIDIMAGAYEGGNVNAAYFAGLALRDVLLGRLYANRYLVENSEKAFESASEALDAFSESSLIMMTNFEKPEHQELGEKAIAAAEQYQTALIDVFKATSERNDIIKNTLDKNGPDVIKSIETFKNEVVKREVAIGEQSKSAVQTAVSSAILVSAVAVVFAIAAAFLIGRGITGPVQSLTQAMRRLADKEMDIEIPATDNKDEVGNMARAVLVFRENMVKADQLAAEQESQQAAREERTRRIEELNHTFDQSVSGVLDTVVSATSQLLGTSNNMSSIAEETSNQSSAAAAAAEQANSNVQMVAASAEELAGSIREIGQQVEESSDIMRTATSKAQSTHAAIEGLAGSSERIGEVVELITDIAEKTNLLALNATIEAARAGDAGKGFAVVASEVKALATQTASATEEIGEQIQAVQTQTRNSVGAIQEIVDTIEHMNKVATAISSAVEEQSAATQEIARNVQEASSGSDEVSRNIQGVTDAATRVGSASGEVQSSTEALSEQSDSLRKLVQDFLGDIRAA